MTPELLLALEIGMCVILLAACAIGDYLISNEEDELYEDNLGR